MRRAAAATSAALALLAATACGDDGGSESGNGSGTPPVALSGTVNDHGTKDAGTATEVEVELDDFYFGPTYVKTQPGTTLALKLKNEGEVPHTMTVEGLGADVTVQPGAEGEASVTLPSSGAVRFFCRFHQGQGMQGAFYFNAGDTVAPGGSAPAGSTGDGGDGAYNQ